MASKPLPLPVWENDVPVCSGDQCRYFEKVPEDRQPDSPDRPVCLYTTPEVIEGPCFAAVREMTMAGRAALAYCEADGKPQRLHWFNITAQDEATLQSLHDFIAPRFSPV